MAVITPFCIFYFGIYVPKGKLDHFMETNGTVIDMDYAYNPLINDNEYYVTVTYSVDNITYTDTDYLMLDIYVNYHVGQIITVWYNPEDHTDSLFYDEIPKHYVITCSILSLLLALGTLLNFCLLCVLIYSKLCVPIYSRYISCRKKMMKRFRLFSFHT